MPPKNDPNAIHVLYLRAVGGEPPNMATLAPKLGPLGVPPKRVGDAIQKGTTEYKGLKCTVKVSIQNRQPSVEIIPSTSTLILKALREPVRDRKKEKYIKHDGNLSLDDIYQIARTMRPKSLTKTFTGTVMEILGTANSIGCTVEGQRPKDIQAQIRKG